MKQSLRMFWVATGLCAALVGQRMQVGEAGVVQVFDVADLIGTPLPDAPARPGKQRSARTLGGAGDLSAFVRAFALTPAKDGEALTMLGDRHLVTMGTPERVAAVEVLLRNVRERLQSQFYVDLRICRVPADAFERELAAILPAVPGHDGGNQRNGLVDAEAMAVALKKLKSDPGVTIIQAPQIVTSALRPAQIAIGEEIGYVRDFEVRVGELVGDGKQLLADPIVDTVWNGTRAEVLCAELPDGTIGVSMHVLEQVVEKPLRKVQTTVPGSTLPVEIEVPHLRGCEGRQVVALTPGTTALMATRTLSGGWLVTTLQVHAIDSPERAAGEVRRELEDRKGR